MNKEAYGLSSYHTSFIIQNASTAGDTQLVTDIKSDWKGAAIKLLVGNAFQANAAFQAMQPGLTTGASNGKLYLHYAKTNYEFINMEPTITFVDMYIFKAKNNVTGTYESPRDTWLTGNDTEEGVGAGIDRSIPGSTPNSAYFKENFKTVVKQTFCMNPGEVRRVSVYEHKNKTIDYAKTVGYIGNLRGVTNHVMFVSRGSPCDNSNVQFTAPTAIYYSPVKIVGTVTTTYAIGCAAKPPRSNYSAVAGLTATYGTVYSMVDEDGRSQLLTGNVVG